jgi:hypothetical protein
VRDWPSRGLRNPRGASRDGSGMGFLRWSNQDHFGRYCGWTDSAAHPNFAANVAVPTERFARAQMALDFERSGERKGMPGGAAEGEGESASVGTVAASLGGI